MFQNAPTEREFLQQISAGGLPFPPLSLRFRRPHEVQVVPASGDAIAEVLWDGQPYEFVIEYKPRSVPSVLRNAVLHAQAYASQQGRYPMVVVPYLGEPQLRELAAGGVSGIDLCGNGVVTVPGHLLVFRSGAPNRFREPAGIKNVFRGASSIAARVFLARAEYASVTEIHEEIRHRGGRVALSTVSKVLQSLEAELIVGRQSGTIRLLQPRKLLERLMAGYHPPASRGAVRGKAPVTGENLARLLWERSRANDLSLAVTGAGSAGRYSVVAREPVLSVYCSDRARLLDGLAFEETNRFPNLKVTETTDAAPYFDLRILEGVPWASPVQTYLETACGDKRDREIAESVEQSILREVGEWRP